MDRSNEIRTDARGTTQGAVVYREDTSRKKWPLALLILLVIAAVIVGALLLRNKNTPDAKKDVTLKTCAADAQGGKPKAVGTIRNSTAKTSNYVVQVDFNDASGNSVSHGVATINDVEASASAKWDLTGATDAKGALTCEITGVTRTHLPGQ